MGFVSWCVNMQTVYWALSKAASLYSVPAPTKPSCNSCHALEHNKWNTLYSAPHHASSNDYDLESY
jgi:hypothetical protein